MRPVGVLPPDLVVRFIDQAERAIGLDWDEVRETVARRLNPTRPIPSDVLDPRRYPSYWCLPVLVGDYLGANRETITVDLERYVAGCLLRHFHYETDRLFSPTGEDELADAITQAYDACTLGEGEGSFDEHFGAKCESWTVLVAAGTQAIGAKSARSAESTEALAAIVAVFSCTQLLDDWHDRAEDRARGHWNMWTDEPLTRTLSVIEPLIRDAGQRVVRLRRHPLQAALTAQLNDTARELADLVDLNRRQSARRPRNAIESGIEFLRERLGAEAPGMWRDFALPGISAGSTECVSAFIAVMLAPIVAGRPIARVVASTLLAHARPSGGWGYREDVVEDADSTAWVLLAVAATGVAAPPGLVDLSHQFLEAHRQADGGIATYSNSERAQLTTTEVPCWSWSDTAVTCSTLLALAETCGKNPSLFQSGCNFVASRHTGRGIESYWWRGPAFASWLATWTLARLGGACYRPTLDMERARLLASRNQDGGWGNDNESNAFDTALAISSLVRLARTEDSRVIHEAASLLVALQDASGRWRGGALMLAPGADDGRDIELRDELVSTACAVAALNEVAQLTSAADGK